MGCKGDTMSTNVRKYISLNRKLATRVKLRAKARGLSEAEVIRQVLDAALPESVDKSDRDAAWEKLLAAMREIAAKGPLPGERTWTRDDAYEERLGRYDKRLSD
jgi:hypothetical protein